MFHQMFVWFLITFQGGIKMDEKKETFEKFNNSAATQLLHIFHFKELFIHKICCFFRMHSLLGIKRKKKNKALMAYKWRSIKKGCWRLHRVLKRKNKKCYEICSKLVKRNQLLLQFYCSKLCNDVLYPGRWRGWACRP